MDRADFPARKRLRVAYACLPDIALSFAEEVSGSGLCFTMYRLVDVGGIVLLQVELEGHCMTVRARVAWCRREPDHFIVGVEFIDLSDDERRRFEAYARRAAAAAC